MTKNKQAKELEAKELEAKELEAKELKAKELEAKELEAKELKAKELEAKELKAKELKAKELKAKETTTYKNNHLGTFIINSIRLNVKGGDTCEILDEIAGKKTCEDKRLIRALEIKILTKV